MTQTRLGFYEFFSGGGMARLGLGARWQALFANDSCHKKAQAYRANFPPARELVVKDIRAVTCEELPGEPTLAWASFPCQDLSLAGDRRGLNGHRSSTFWPFWDLMEGLSRKGKPVPIIVLENVVGAITSNSGTDFEAILSAMVESGYQVGPLVVNSSWFVPQSRPRLFVVGCHNGIEIEPTLQRSSPCMTWHPTTLRIAHERLPAHVVNGWVWWRLPIPRRRVKRLSEIIEDSPKGVEWHSKAETRKILSLMSPQNIEKVRQVQLLPNRVVGTVYKRTRKDANGISRQRAEVRFDEMSGCLRTPVGGSSRQIIMIVEGDHIRTRLLSPREAATLMGVPRSYKLPPNYNEAYHLMGDGLVVPVVSWLEEHLIHPLATGELSPQERGLGVRQDYSLSLIA
ncbi:MAG: DNA cytosine methyltransferase [Candidatus Omnitrophica bacterium]|nr:DNA cytosine methyltransferase [Candidatus Omnitrophota bacterium]